MDERTTRSDSSGQALQPTGKVAELIYLCDWAATPLGPLEAWPHTLRIITDLIFASQIPMAVLWDRDALLIYNEAYAGVLGARHPSCLGRPACDTFAEILPNLKSQLAGFWSEKTVSAVDDFPLKPIDAIGNSRMKISYSPIRDENGNLTGVLGILTETMAGVPSDDTEKEASLRELHHWLKNNLQLITSLINLEANQTEDRRVLTLLDATRNRIYSIATIHDLIYRSQGYGNLDMAAYARQLVPELLRLHDAEERVEVKVDGDSTTLELDRAVPFGLLLNELVSGVCKNTFPSGQQGKVSIRFGRENQYNVLTVADSAVGSPPRPDFDQASSLGLRLVHMLAQQLGGDVTVAPGIGTPIRVRFPITQAMQEDDV